MEQIMTKKEFDWLSRRGKIVQSIVMSYKITRYYTRCVKSRRFKTDMWIHMFLISSIKGIGITLMIKWWDLKDLILRRKGSEDEIRK